MKKSLDYNVDFVIARDCSGRIFVLTYRRYRSSVLSEIIDSGVDTIKEFHPLRAAVETIGAQQWVADGMRTRLHKEKVKVSIVDLQHPASQGDKEGRILGRLQPLEANEKFFIKEEHRDFIYEHNFYPAVRHDDLHDACEMACEVSFNPPDDTIFELACKADRRSHSYTSQPVDKYGAWVR